MSGKTISPGVFVPLVFGFRNQATNSVKTFRHDAKLLQNAKANRRNGKNHDADSPLDCHG
jgi:hypothetical protein